MHIVSDNYRRAKKEILLNNVKIAFLLIFPILLTCAVVTLKHPVLNIETPPDWNDETIIILRDSVELELKEGQTLTLGLQCHGAGGNWGTIDDFELTPVK